MEEYIRSILEGSGIIAFVYFIIKGLRKEVSNLNATIKQQNETVEAMSRRVSETEKMADCYKLWWEELSENYEKHKKLIVKAKDDLIDQLERANRLKDEKLRRQTEDKLRTLQIRQEEVNVLDNLFPNDRLTGVYNRKWIQDYSVTLIEQARRNNFMVALFFIDLDHFKVINDALGHRIGDMVLIEVAKRLTLCVGDSVARLGGDEFLLMMQIAGHEQVKAMAQKILQSISQPMVITGQECSVTATLGISLYPQDGLDLHALLRKADAAMCEGKGHGRGLFRIYDGNLT